MEWFNFDIKDVWRTAEGMVRGQVRFRFVTERPDGIADESGPVHPSVEVNVFIKLDAQASFAEVERALLEDARRLLSEALSRSDGANPQEIRSAVDRDRAAQERRWREESDAELAEALKDIGKPQPAS